MLAYLRIGGAVLAAVLLAALFVSVRGAYKAKAELADTQKQLADERAHSAALNRAAATSQRLQVNYEKELALLRGNASRPPPVVRLCHSPAPASVPAAAAPTAGSGPTLAPGGDVRTTDTGGDTAGPDIGPALIAIARDADAVLAQCRITRDYALEAARIAGLPLDIGAPVP